MRPIAQKSPVSLLLKALLLLIGLVGQWATYALGGLGGGRLFLYFTNQSNLLMSLVTAAFLVALLLGKPLPRWLWTLKFVATVAVTLTYVAFHLLLMPFMWQAGMGDYYWSLSNMGVHVLAPLLAVVDWALCTPPSAARRIRSWQGLLMPLYYLGFFLVCSALGVRFGADARAPYFFLDYHQLGWFRVGQGGLGVTYYIVLICLLVLLLAQGLRSLPPAGEEQSAS